jgi:hypothetical protein
MYKFLYLFFIFIFFKISFAEDLMDNYVVFEEPKEFELRNLNIEEINKENHKLIPEKNILNEENSETEETISEKISTPVENIEVLNLNESVNVKEIVQEKEQEQEQEQEKSVDEIDELLKETSQNISNQETQEKINTEEREIFNKALLDKIKELEERISELEKNQDSKN